MIFQDHLDLRKITENIIIFNIFKIYSDADITTTLWSTITISTTMRSTYTITTTINVPCLRMRRSCWDLIQLTS